MNEAVTIAGGGLAGLSLAAGLRMRGLPVTVHEAGSYPRHRVCGEFISGVEARTLESLGIADVLAGGIPRSSVAWFREGRMIHEDSLPVPASGISRYSLDRILRDRVISLGGEVIEGSRQARKPREGLVWAAGRIPTTGRWIGLKCHYRGLEMIADLEMHLGSNGYVGLAGVEGGRVNACGLFRVDRTLRGNGAELLTRYLKVGGNSVLAERLAASQPDPDSFCAVAGFELGRQDADPTLCVVGDAESMIPPFTGNGMSMAFEAAELSLDPLASWSHGEIPWNRCVSTIRDRLHRRFRKRMTAAQALHPLLLNSGGRQVIEAMARARILPFRPLLSLVR